MNNKLVISWLHTFWDFTFAKEKKKCCRTCIACEQSTRKSKKKIPSSKMRKRRNFFFSKFLQYSCCSLKISFAVRCYFFFFCTCSDCDYNCWFARMLCTRNTQYIRVHSIEMLSPVTTIQEYEICSIAISWMCCVLSQVDDDDKSTQEKRRKKK